MKRLGKLATTLCALAATAVPAAWAGTTPLTTTRIASGLARPLWVEQAPGETDRLFIVEQRSGNQGRIRTFNLNTNTLNPTPFLSITVSTGSEQGLLGMAFHPDYANNGKFYVNYTNTSGTTIIAEYTASPPSAPTVNPATARIIWTVAQPFTNHNAGWLGFGPDGYLYIPLGDGGSGGDPGNRSQNPLTPLGKMLRIDIDGDDFPTDPNRNYAIPADNPFAGGTNPLPEIWALGLRNAYRCDFDNETGDFYIADVGQNAWEEIDFQPASSTGGENYGWRCYEGNATFNTVGCQPASAYVFPIYEYSHSFGCSVTGGSVYRGNEICDLRGTYFFSDFCSNQIWTFRYDTTNGLTDFQNRTGELAPGGGLSISGVSSISDDNSGELYICDLFGGEVFKIIPNGPGNPCPTALLGDMNCDGVITVGDVGPFVLALTDPAGYAASFPDCDINNGDINEDGFVTVGDIGAFVALVTGM